MPRLGAHMSVAGGLYLAFERIGSVDGESLQIFTRNQRQWHPAELSSDEVDDFKAAWRDFPGMEVASHGSYLVNLASGKEDVKGKSIQAFILELERCQQLGIDKVVLHPGSHTGAGVEKGIERFAAALDEVLEKAKSDTRVLVETTAGQGTGLGSSAEELGAILAASKNPDRLGVCLDTCHIFAAGYDIRTQDGYAKTMAEFDRHVGLDRIEFFHLNDSKKDLGSRVDRHTHIGDGCIGLEGFRNLLTDSNFDGRPMTLETPKEENLEDDRKNLATLRSLLK